ncbi:uncharacterized protein LOC140704290 isoform X2 [Pogona vitticeps]
MSARKLQGNQKGKQRARKRPVPELSPPQSSSDEEAWPVWQKLQQQVAALERARLARAPPARGGEQPRRSTRDAKGHCRAKLWAIAQDIKSKVAILEAELQSDEASDDTVAPPERSGKSKVHTASESGASLAITGSRSKALEETNRVKTVAPPVPGTPAVPRRRHIIMTGHSFVFWAKRHAATSPRGSDLGLDGRAHMDWRGHHGMLWSQLCQAVAFGQHPPDVLMIHLGSNHLAQYPGRSLVVHVICDLTWLKGTYPEMQIIWSTIIPHLFWKGVRQPCLQPCLAGNPPAHPIF